MLTAVVFRTSNGIIMLRRVISPISSEFRITSTLKNNFKYCNTMSFTSDSSTLLQGKEDYQPIANFYAGKSVFITGGTGFLGKILIERLLFNCTDIDKVYVLVRMKRGIEAKERLKDITDNVLFSKLKEIRPKDINKIIPIAGDITLQKLGIKPEDENTLLEKVSVAVHSAADVRFNLPLKEITKLNVESTRELLCLSRQMKNIQAFVFISTAFSNAEKSSMIDEIVYPAPRKLSQVYEFIERGGDDVNKFLNGKPNSYSFSKALAETVIKEQHKNIPAIIIRPSIICCVKNGPIPGWIDNWYGPTGLVYFASKGINRVIPGKESTPMNLVPADYTANLAIVAAARCGNSNEVKVYNSCTRPEDPLMWRTLVENFVTEYQKIDSENGKQAKIYYSAYPSILTILTFVLHKIPAYSADLWLRFTGKKPRFMKELLRTLAVRDVLLYFTNTKFTWSIRNVSVLNRSLSREDRKRFPFDPTDIKWNNYIKLYCAGVYKYLVLKEQKNRDN